MPVSPISMSQATLVSFCERNSICRLSLFGSVLTDRFRPDSDVDMLVQFHSGKAPSLLGMARLERELSDLVGREADRRTAPEFSRYFREQVRLLQMLDEA